MNYYKIFSKENNEKTLSQIVLKSGSINREVGKN